MSESNSWETQTVGESALRPFGIRDILQIIAANFILLLICLGLGIWLGLTIQELTPRAYRSVGNFVVDELPFSQSSGNIDAETERQLIQTQILSLPSRDMRTAIEKRLGLPSGRVNFSDLDVPLKLTGKEPRANIDVSAVRNSRIGLITATSQDPEFAAAVVNAMLDEMQMFNLIGGRIKNLRLSLDFSKTQAETTLRQLSEISSQRLKVEKETSALDEYVRLKLPLESFPAFATDATLNNLKTQLILVQSEYDSIASTSVRGSRVVGKRAEVDGLKALLARHSQMLASGLRSQLEILQTQENNLRAEIQTLKDQIDLKSEQAARYAQSVGDPPLMEKLLKEAHDGPSGGANVIQIIDRATPIFKPVRPVLAINLALGIAFGGALGIGIVALRVLLDTRLRSAEQIERRTGKPCLAVLPDLQLHSDELRTQKVFGHGEYPIGLGYLRTHLLRPGRKAQGDRIVGFTTTRPSRHCSDLVADLAILLAQAEKKTLILDLHLRAPQIAKILGTKIQKELNGWFNSEDSLGDYINYSAVRELAVLSMKESDQEDLNDLMSRRMLAPALLELLGEWDYVLIDAPNILTDWNLMLALPEYSPLIITARYRRTTADDVLQLLDHARGPRWKVEGVVLTHCPKRLTRGGE